MSSDNSVTSATSTLLTTSGQAAVLTDRNWGPLTAAPDSNGVPYKLEAKKAGRQPNWLVRFTIWLAKDLRPHNHPWAFTSTVLRGCLTEARFIPIRNGKYYRVEYHTYFAGETYRCDHGVIHMIVDVEVGTQTVMEIEPLKAGPADWESFEMMLVGDTGLYEMVKTVSDPTFRARWETLNKPSSQPWDVNY